MATLKQIRQRIRAAKNIQQITQAMKLVAAARLKKAQDSVEQARPYAEKMLEFMGSIGGGDSLPDHPLLARREITKATLVLVTADRGLAGAYNSNLLRAGQAWLREQGAETEIVAVGKKGEGFFARRGHEVIRRFDIPSTGARLEDATAITDFVSERFLNGETDAVYLLYSKFYSPIRQVPMAVQLLPIEPPAAEGGKGDYDFEPDSQELLRLLLPQYLLTVGLQALLEAAASEHGARMTAMTSATDNAGEMIDTLTLKANRARQADITKQILEIVGGAEALKA